MAAAFGITVDNLLKNDLRKLRETPDMSLPLNASRPMTVSHSGSIPPANPTRVPAFSEPQPLAKVIEKYQPEASPLRMVSRQVNLKPVSGDVPQPIPNNQNYSQFLQKDTLPVQHSDQLPVFNNQYQPTQPTAPIEERTNNYPVIQWVSRSMADDYIFNSQNPAYLTRLPSFQLPNLPAGYYRAFESGEDFAYPSALLVGSFVRNWYDIKDGGQYVFVIRNQGFIYRNAFNQVKSTGALLLTSDIGTIPNMEVLLQDVMEVWEVKAFISLQLPEPQPSLERVNQLVEELQAELNQYKQ
jgi:hypothetical protein